MDPNRMGRMLFSKIFRRDPFIGGTLGLAWGEPGAGKSTFLYRLGKKALELGDVVVWRGRTRDVWFYFDEVVVHKHKDLDLRIVKYKLGGKVHDATEEFRVKEFSDIGELLHHFEDGAINVVYAPSYTPVELLPKLGLKVNLDLLPEPAWWYEFLLALTRTASPKWYSVLIDEFQEIAPAQASGVMWSLIAIGQNVMNDLRGNQVSFFAATHQHNLVDYRILGKFMYYFYLRGAKIPRHSVLKKYRIRTVYLNRGAVVIESVGSGTWGKISVAPLKQSEYVYQALLEWRGNVPQAQQDSPLLPHLTFLARTQGFGVAKAELDSALDAGRITPSTYYYYLSVLNKLAKRGEHNEMEV